MKSRLIAFLLLVYLSPLVAAPPQESPSSSQTMIDSLRRELKDGVKDSLQKLAIYKALSVSYWKKSPDSSIFFAERSIRLIERSGTEEEKGDAFYNLGVAYFYANDFKSSLDYFYQSLEIREKMTDLDKVGRTLNSIGNIYYSLNKVPEAIDFYKRSLLLTRKSNNKKMEASILNNMGSLYGSHGKIDTAYILLNQSVTLLEKLNDSIGLSSSYNNMALLYRENGEYKKALEYDEKALSINKKMGRTWDISFISNSLGETYLSMNNYEQAYSYFKRGLEAAETIEAQDNLLFSYRSLTKYYSAVGNYKQFSNYFDKYEAIKDSIFTTQNTSSIAEMQVKYETEHKEKENALQKLQIAKERSLRNSFVYISIIVLIVGVILLFRFLAKKKRNEELEKVVKMRTHDLLVNESKLKEAQRIGKSGSWDWDLRKNKLNWSDELPVILGLTNGTINYRAILKKTHPEDLDKLLSIFRKEFDSKECYFDFDFRLMESGKISKYISLYGEVKRDDFNVISLVQGSIQDITERKIAELALRESEELYRQLISASPDAVFEINSKGIIVFANQQSKSLFRISNEKGMLGTHINEWIAKTEQVRIQESLKDGFDNMEQFDLHLVLERKDGSTFIGELKTARIYDGDGNKKGMIVVLRDITDRKQLEQRILRNTIETEERERQRFSEDLHDGLGPLLSAAKIHLELIAARMNRPKEQLKFIKMTDELLYDSIQSTREIANNLTPNLLNDFGLVEAMGVYVEKINKMNTISIDFKVAEKFKGLSKQTEVALYRVISELINNTLKHASASKIDISILQKEKEIEINYRDNGIGFDVEKMLSSHYKGLGLSNIISRLKSINGTCVFKSESGQNFTCKIRIALDGNNELVLKQTKKSL